MASPLHIIFGTGPAGCWTARSLRQQGIPVKAVNRSGMRPALMSADVEILTADVSVPEQAIKAAKGATVVYQVANPPYHEWDKYFPGLQAGALAAAEAAGARYVSIENLYMYDSSSPMNEKSRVAPRSTKGELHAPALTQRSMIEKSCNLLGTAMKFSVISLRNLWPVNTRNGD